MSVRADLGIDRLSRFFTLSLDMLCIADFDGYFNELNPVWEHTLGWTLEELRARPFLEFVHPDDRPATIAEASRLQLGADTVWFENRYARKDGSYVWLAWRATASAQDRLYYAVARDITDRKEAEKKLVEERNRLAAILSSMADGAVITDPNGRIVLINPAMERFAGWAEEEVRGRAFSDVYPASDDGGASVPIQERFLARAIELRESVTSRGYGINVLTRDGRGVPVNVSAAPILDASGGLLGGVAVVRDVSHEREVDELKTSLISTVSHELRTPLTMIQGFSDLLLSGRLDHQRSQEALQEINTASKRLARLIDNLLSVSRIESGRVTVRPVPLRIYDVVRSVLGMIARDREILVSFGDDLPAVLADRDHLIQILTNLTSNAVKYSPPGGQVFIHAEPNGSMIEVSVSDQGIGLTEEDVAGLFKKFARVDRPEVRDVPGTGLGLFITKRLVELQDGHISVRSTPGEGSTFTFSLPRVEEEPGTGDRDLSKGAL